MYLFNQQRSTRRTIGHPTGTIRPLRRSTFLGYANPILGSRSGLGAARRGLFLPFLLEELAIELITWMLPSALPCCKVEIVQVLTCILPVRIRILTTHLCGTSQKVCFAWEHEKLCHVFPPLKWVPLVQVYEDMPSATAIISTSTLRESVPQFHW